MPEVPSRGVLILAGGRGERFWPWSTPTRPKQLLPLASGGRTLLAATFARALRVTTADRVVIMTAETLVEACQRECPGAIVVGEPVMRNTAPAIAAAAAFFGETDAFAVLPADHAIDNEEAFALDFARAFEVAERDAVLVTFGIPATEPDPSFGYLQRGVTLGERLFRVARFTEKPTREKATEWLSTGGYLWNSGMFVWKRNTFFDALAASRPLISEALRDLSFASGDERAFERALAERFPTLESISVDYAVLEHAPNTVAVEATFDWDDLGSWSAWARRQSRDARGNVVFGDAVVVDCDDCVVVGEGGIAAAMGLRDMVVVHVNGATLTCPLSEAEKVRHVSEAVRARGSK